MRIRPNWTVLGLGALVVVALFLYPQWRVLINRGAASNAGTYANVSVAQRDILLQMRRTPGANPDQAYQALLVTVPAPTSDAPTPDSAVVQPIESGDFVALDAVHTATGHVTLYRLADNTLMLRFDNFAVSNGPQLNVYLCAADKPQTAQDLKTGKLQFLVGQLKGTSGAQNYTRIPAELDLSRYKSVVIFSESLQAVYSSAPLQ